MRSRSYLLTVLAVFALLAVLGVQGCLFGGGGGGEEGGEETPSGEEGAPSGEGGAPAGEMMGGGEAAPAGGEGAPPAGGEAPMEGGGEAPMGGAPASGAAAEALQAKHAGDWNAARAKCEEALAANPDDAEAHRIMGWILADTDPAGATQHLNAYLGSGAQGPQADEVKAALERLAAR